MRFVVFGPVQARDRAANSAAAEPGQKPHPVGVQFSARLISASVVAFAPSASAARRTAWSASEPL